MSVPARMTMTAGAAGACAKLAATNAMVEIAASMYRIRTSWELGGHHTSSNAKTENWKPRTGNQELETKNWQLFPVGKTVLSSYLPVLSRDHHVLFSLPPSPPPRFRPAYRVRSVRCFGSSKLRDESHQRTLHALCRSSPSQRCS